MINDAKILFFPFFHNRAIHAYQFAFRNTTICLRNRILASPQAEQVGCMRDYFYL